MQVRSLGQEHPWRKGMAIHYSILAWRIPRTEEPGALYIVHRVAELDMTRDQTLMHATWSYRSKY